MIVDEKTAPARGSAPRRAATVDPTPPPPVPAALHRHSATMVDRARTGDGAAFDHLVARHVDDVHSFLFHRTGSLTSAEELTRELFTSVLRSMNTFRWTGVEFGPWLLRRARQLTDQLRDTDLAPAGHLGPLADLGAAQRDCLLLRFVLGWAVPESAQALGRGQWATRQLQLAALVALSTLDDAQRPRALDVLRREASTAHHADAFDTQLSVPRQRGRRAEGPYEELRDLVVELRQTPGVTPREEFVDALRADLLALATDVLLEVPAPAPEADVRPRSEALRPGRSGPSRPLVLGVVASAVAAPFLAWAVGTSAPGDLLHPGKAALESVQMAGAEDDSEAGQLLLEHATARLDEVRSLVADGDLARARSTLGTFSLQAAEGERLLSRSGTDADYQALRWFAHDAIEALGSLGSTAALSDDVATATEQVTETDVRAATACATCTAQE
ncbi:MAG: sigma factor [Nocardioides sp.]|uniref:sigma factor n=1 Tax=Nocardioides sp. TaxID=35761 RepID=UPI003F0EE5DB